VDRTWKIGDFGLTTEGTSVSQHSEYGRGTSGYRAPELIGQEPVFSNKVDIFALGCILFELVSHGRKAFTYDWEVFEYKSCRRLPLAFHELDVVLKTEFGTEMQEMLLLNWMERPSAQNLRQRFIRKRVEANRVAAERSHEYTLIRFPTSDQLRIAACRWDQIAGHILQYAFAGSLAALLTGGEVVARGIEIAIECGGLGKTSAITDANPQFLGITEHQDLIIVVREDETYRFGISMRCYELAS